MRLSISKGKQKLFFRIFISLTLCIGITMLLLSTILYINFQNVASEQIYLANVKSLTQCSKVVSMMSNTALNISNQIYRDANISKLLFYAEPEVYDEAIALRQLTWYRLTMANIIDSIYVYNGSTGTYYIDNSTYANADSIVQKYIQKREEFEDKQINDIIDHYENYKPYIPIPRKYVDSNKVEKSVYTYLMYDLFQTSYSQVVVNINADWIRSVMNDEGDKDSDTFIVNSSGVQVSVSRKNTMLTDLSGNAYIKRILGRTDSPGYFIETLDGVKSLVVYTTPDFFGWRYIRIIPWGTIFNKVEGIRTVTICISLGILILGTLIAFILSGRLYVPIGNLYTNLEYLEREKRKSFVAKKQDFLRDIVLGRVINNKEEFYTEYNEVGFNIGIDSKVCLLLVRIDRYNEYVQNYDLEDRNLYKFAICNIANEVLSECGKTEAIDMGNDIVLIALDASNLDDETKSAVLTERLRKIQSFVTDYFNISISITVSSIDKGIESLCQFYNQAVEKSLHRLFKGHGCIIFTDEMTQLQPNEYIYPIQKEKQLYDALMSGKIDEANKIYLDIVGETSKYPLMVYNLTISHLLVMLNNAMHSIKSKNHINDNWEPAILTSLFSNMEVLEEVNKQFNELFKRIGEWVEIKKNVKHENIISKVNSIINQEYANSNLSIESIAEAMDLSSAHLCRIYRQYTMHTILDDITEIRMKKARELLTNTNFSITEISNKVGFSNDSYFYKSFKQTNGVTPTEYRKNVR